MIFISILILISSISVAIRRDKSISYARSAIETLITASIININSSYYQVNNKALGLFHGLFHISAVTQVFHTFLFVVSALILQLNSFYPRKVWTENFSSMYKWLFCKLVYFNGFIENKKAKQFKILEYPIIIMFILLGGVFLICSSDFMSVFLSIELQSYGLYILCSIYRDSEKATSAGLTYFLLGGLSSCFILLSSGIFYANSANTGFDSLYIINNISAIADNVYEMFEISFNEVYKSYYVNFSLVILSIGFLFKVTASPFHSWSPDVYDAIPTIVTTFVAIFAKISIFIFLLELVNYTTSLSVSEYQTKQEYAFSNFSWTFTFLVSSLLSLLIGSLAGLTQFRIKRLYAYSTISHIGFILLALTVNSVESIQSFTFYLMQYSIANLNAFIILVTIGFSLYTYVETSKDLEGNKIDSVISKISDKNNSPLQYINQIKGLFYINPILSISLALTIFSFVGIPPLIGFFAKQMVISSAINSGYNFMVFIAILTSVISAYYYLVIIKQMFFFSSDYVVNPQLKDITIITNITNFISNYKVTDTTNNVISLSSTLSSTISILSLVIMLFIWNPEEWLSMTNILATTIFYN
uniref:NADH-ubiquinone oxidoreductase chain 2 n=1 Tax=Arthonia cupressina TaxID=2563722 RepID=A0A4V1FUK2_9PEZI|nr:NADH dehydrogenase subunit 2 [Arthonia cupressina]